MGGHGGTAPTNINVLQFDIFLILYNKKVYTHTMKTPQRKSLRLKHYDYTQNGFYFITICIQHKTCLLGEIINKKMIRNEAGSMLHTLWHEIPYYYEGFKVHEFVVMPNHIHGIIEIVSQELSLSDVLQRFKTLTTNRYIHGVKHHHWIRFDKQLWQRSYYEHIIRDEKKLEEIQTYIINNPINWDKDSLFR